MKTFALTLLVILAPVLPARALDNLPDIFADCAGQFSAMVEHAWLVQDPRADAFEERRDLFLNLIDAVGDRSDPASLNRRIEAKAGQAWLLREASFGTDRSRASWAARRAAAQISACSLLLLDS